MQDQTIPDRNKPKYPEIAIDTIANGFLMVFNGHPKHNRNRKLKLSLTITK